VTKKANRFPTASKVRVPETACSDFFLQWPLPPSPSIIRYIDDFSKNKKSIRYDERKWKFRIDGVSSVIDWDSFSSPYQDILKRFLVWCVSKYDASSLLNFVQMFRAHSKFIESFVSAFVGSVDEAKVNWEKEFTASLKKHKGQLARAFASFLSSQSLCGWSNDDAEFLKSWNWYGFQQGQTTQFENEQHRLSADSEIQIISYLETVAGRPDCLSTNVEASILYWVYQHGFRPGQIATLDVQDVKIISSADNNRVKVHATFYRAKQRSVAKRTPMLRKMKSEWANIMAEVMKNRSQSRQSFERIDSVFGMTPAEISELIISLTTRIVGKAITATDLRHNAAQRLADSGASHLQLAEFMGHAHLNTSLQYFYGTPTQAAKVNMALGLSPIYQKVQNIATQETLTSNELLALPADKQVGGANHGISFAGIGGCAIGQSLCELSPAISCYTCPKFLPLNDETLHSGIADELRDVVKTFYGADFSGENSPAFAQLRNTLERIHSIIEEIRVQP